MEEEIKTRATRVGDIGVLIGIVKQMGLAGVLDRSIKRHPLDQGLSWGWVISIWLVYIVSQGDHRKVKVEDWVGANRESLELLTGLCIRQADFTDDRLTIALRHLSEDERWNAIEQDLGRSLIRVYELPCETIRVDATTVSGHHQGGKGSWWQYGHSKDDPALRQVKLMMAALDPLGLPLQLLMASGESADDPLYLPVIEGALQCVDKTGLLIVGDCKMSALSTRAAIHQAGQHYLTPLALVGEVPAQLEQWVRDALANPTGVHSVLIKDEKGAEKRLARGYEVKRVCTHEAESWEERVLVVQSEAHAAKERQSVEERLQKAEAALLALTPPIGRGKRQIREEADLRSRAEAILKTYRVTGLLTYTYERQCEQKEKLIGRGRGGPNRERQIVEQVRYQITGVKRAAEAIALYKQKAGWRAYGTDAPQTRLRFEQAVLEYRNEYRVERDFGRFKGDRLVIAPMFVTRSDQVVGLPRLLSLGVRLLTLIEFVARESLREQGRPLAGLYPGQPAKVTKVPTAERLLQAFVPINLIMVSFRDRTVYQVDGFSALHKRIVEILRLPLDLYTSLIKTVKRATESVIAV